MQRPAGGFSTDRKVSKRWRGPSWIYWPRLWRSVLKTAAGREEALARLAFALAE